MKNLVSLVACCGQAVCFGQLEYTARQDLQTTWFCFCPPFNVISPPGLMVYTDSLNSSEHRLFKQFNKLKNNNKHNTYINYNLFHFITSLNKH